MKDIKDLLIVGQGIGGTMLAWHALKKGLSLEIYDIGALKSSSAVSSGIINPVTGLKFVKSWMIEEFLPYAVNIYQQIGESINQQVIKKAPIWCHLDNIKAENQWQSRLIEEGYGQHITDPDDPMELKNVLQNVNRFGIVKNGWRVDMMPLLTCLRSRWLRDGILTEEGVDITQVQKKKDGLFHYGEKIYRHVILSLGHLGRYDHWFRSKYYHPVKGEILICHIEGLPEDRIIKYKKFIVPLGDNKYWVGSNYDHDFTDTNLDVAKAQEIIDLLVHDIQKPYKILNHLTGIRPSTETRRPFIGEHRDQKGLFLFNGLGTKGISLAPYFSEKLISAIANEASYQTEAFGKSFFIDN